jgi:hypothetical protein
VLRRKNKDKWSNGNDADVIPFYTHRMGNKNKISPACLYYTPHTVDDYGLLLKPDLTEENILRMLVFC